MVSYHICATAAVNTHTSSDSVSTHHVLKTFNFCDTLPMSLPNFY